MKVQFTTLRAGMIAAGEDLVEYSWSSLPAYLSLTKRPDWLECDCILGEMGAADRPDTGTAYLEHLRRCGREGTEKIDENGDDEAKGKWFLGSKGFGAKLMDRLKAIKETDTEGPQLKRPGGDYGETMAEIIVIDGLKRFGLNDADLLKLAKNDWRKRLIGHAIRNQTSVTLGWISHRLAMGAVSHVCALCGTIADIPENLKGAD